MPKPKDQGALLTTARPNTIHITLNSQSRIEIAHTDHKMAEIDYQRIKAQGTYQGQWIKEIYLA